MVYVKSAYVGSFRATDGIPMFGVLSEGCRTLERSNRSFADLFA